MRRSPRLDGGFEGATGPGPARPPAGETVVQGELKAELPAAGSGSPRVQARWCGLPPPPNQARTHVVGCAEPPTAAGRPPPVKWTRRTCSATSSAPVTVKVKSCPSCA